MLRMMNHAKKQNTYIMANDLCSNMSETYPALFILRKP